ncbi:MAG: RluA family pseudouridine synthase [Thiomicrorhabdus sp.]|nr:RluA family pseudouridine synthase [Thiomicrorhabdus sp.]
MPLPDKQHFTIFISISGLSALENLYVFLQSQTDLINLNISKQMLKNYAQRGAIWLSRHSNTRKPERLRRLKKVLSPNDRLEFYYEPSLLHSEPTPPTLIADYEQYSVWLKPRGMLSQGSKWADHTALYRWVEMHYQPNNQPRQCWIVHRLDRATCGLMLLAHSKKMAAKLSALFEQKQIHKRYQANVWGDFPCTPQTFNTPVQDKPAVSHVQLLEKLSPPSFSLTLPSISSVQITIETGRKHQIRTHLSHAGYPIVGDRLYGNNAYDDESKVKFDLQLTADQLEFICPITQVTRTFALTEAQRNLYL